MIHPYIQNYSGFIPQVCFSIGTLGRRIVAPITSVIERSRSICERVHKSVIGKYVINSIRENTLECLGAMGGSALGEWYLGGAMEDSCSRLGRVVGTTAVIGIGTLTSLVAYRWTKKNQHSLVKIGGSALAGTTITAISGLILPQIGAQAGAIIGRRLGSLVGSQAGGILGGFVAISLSGSEEVLIDRQRPLNSYTIKAFQANIACNMMNRCVTFHPVIQPIYELTIGALAYHSIVVIKPIMKQISNGTLLDEVLPAEFTLTVKEQSLIQEGIRNAYHNPFYQEKALSLMTSNGLKREIFQPFFNQDIEAFVDQVRMSHETSSKQQVEGIFMRTLNQYFLFLQNPDLKLAHQRLTTAFIQLQQAPSQDQQFLLEQTTSCQQQLLRTLNEASSQLLESHPILKGFRQNIIDEALIEKFIVKWISRMEKLEEQLFAFPITYDALSSYTRFLAMAHLESFNRMLYIEMTKPLQEWDAASARECYQHILSLFTHYYSVGINSRFPSLFCLTTKKTLCLAERFLANQIQTAKFSSCSVSNFLDLQAEIRQWQ